MMKESILGILFLHITLLSLSQSKKLDSIIAFYENELRYACKGPIVKNVEFEEKKMDQDREYVQIMSSVLLQKLSFNEIKKKLWKKKATHYISKHKLDSNTVYEIFFYGNYISGHMLLFFNGGKLISSGVTIDNSYRRFCWDKTGPNISLVDMELVRNVILPIIPNDLISEILDDVVAGDYRSLFSKVVSKSGKEVKR